MKRTSNEAFKPGNETNPRRVLFVCTYMHIYKILIHADRY